jgi:hypothetical protein
MSIFIMNLLQHQHFFELAVERARQRSVEERESYKATDIIDDVKIAHRSLAYGN